MLNGIDSLVVTKLDVFDAQPEIKVCTGYRHNGRPLTEMPPDVETLSQVEPEYRTLPGWRKPTPGIRDVKDLPIAARDYLNFISDFLQVEIGMISTGPERDATIVPRGTRLSSWLWAAMLSAEEAREKVIEVVAARAGAPATEEVDIPATRGVLGRILGRDVVADRNYPPFDRSTRDGFAVRSSDASAPGARLRLIGESRAGVPFEGTVGAGQCVRILTGAPVPRGANAVVMQEHARAEGDFVVLDQPARPGQNFVFAGAQARVGEMVVARGSRLGYAELAMLAEVGRVSVPVTRVRAWPSSPPATKSYPSIRRRGHSKFATAMEFPSPRKWRSPVASRFWPATLRIRPANFASTSTRASKPNFDFERRRVDWKVRPGRAGSAGTRRGIFLRCRGHSPGQACCVWMVPWKAGLWLAGKSCFHDGDVRAVCRSRHRIARRIYAAGPAVFQSQAAHPVAEKRALAHYLPARVSWPNGESCADRSRNILWEGSGDIGAVVRGNCFLVASVEAASRAGEWVDVLPHRGKF